MRRKLLTGLAAGLLAATALAACGSGSDTGSASGGASVVVGSAGFSENETLALIYGGALKNAGAQVTYKLKLGSREVVEPALESGQIDLVPEYLGNYLGFLDPSQSSGAPVDQAAATLKKVAMAKGLTVGAPSAATDGDVVAVTKATATSNALVSIGDLAKLPAPVTFAGPSECETRPTCLLGLKSVYGLDITFVSTGSDAGGPITKKSLDDGKAVVARLFSSDSDVAKGGKYLVLKDDRSFQPAGNIVPVLRTAKATPALVAVLDKVSAALNDAGLIELNKQTDVDKKDPARVADAFLKAHDL